MVLESQYSADQPAETPPTAGSVPGVEDPQRSCRHHDRATAYPAPPVAAMAGEPRTIPPSWSTADSCDQRCASTGVGRHPAERLAVAAAGGVGTEPSRSAHRFRRTAEKLPPAVIDSSYSSPLSPRTPTRPDPVSGSTAALGPPLSRPPRNCQPVHAEPVQRMRPERAIRCRARARRGCRGERDRLRASWSASPPRDSQSGPAAAGPEAVVELSIGADHEDVGADAVPGHGARTVQGVPAQVGEAGRRLDRTGRYSDAVRCRSRIRWSSNRCPPRRPARPIGARSVAPAITGAAAWASPARSGRCRRRSTSSGRAIRPGPARADRSR